MKSTSNESKKEIDLRDSKKETNESGESKKEYDLRENKMTGVKSKRTYDLNDNEIKVITLDNDITVKLIANNKGVFVDFRKYYKGYPTKKGIRILASNFKKIWELLVDDIMNQVPGDLEDLNNII